LARLPLTTWPTRLKSAVASCRRAIEFYVIKITDMSYDSSPLFSTSGSARVFIETLALWV